MWFTYMVFHWILNNKLKLRLDLLRNLNWDCQETNPPSLVLGAGFELGACALHVAWHGRGLFALRRSRGEE